MLKLKKHLILFTLVLSLAIVGMAQNVNAAYNNALQFPTCALSIHPFNTGGTVVNDLANQWFNIFSGSGKCTQHLQYPSQYNPQPPTVQDNPLKNVTGVENIHAPTTRHNHVYHNASVEDSFWYKSYMAKFQITLEQDALLNTNKFNVVCGTPTGPNTYVETPGCNGTVSNWGTTKISYNSLTGVATWDFAESSSKTGRPMLWGQNPSLNKQHGYWGAYVKLVSKDNPQEVWSATTTSDVLIRDLALLKSSDDDGDAPSCANDGKSDAQKNFNGNWCTMNKPNLPGVGAYETNDGKQYYWYRIGVVGTTWQRTTPEETPPVCEDLTLSINQGGNTYTPGNLTGLEPNQPMTMTVTPSFTPSNQSVPLEYQWTANLNAQPEGYFTDYTNAPQQSNPFTDNDTGIYYSGGAAGTTVQVVALDQGVPQSQCSVPFIIPDTPLKPSCVDVILTPNALTAPGTTNYTATVQFSDSQTYNTTIAWTGNGTFSNGTTQTGLSPFQNTFTTSATTASVNVKVTGLPPNVDNSPKCQQGATVTSTDEGMCVALTANYTKPVEAGDSIFLDPNVIYSGNLQPSQIQWQETGDGYFFDFLTSTIQPPSFTALYTSAYIYNAVSEGDKFTLTAIPNPTNNPACTLSETIIKPPDQDEPCDYLNFDINNNQICINVDPDYNGRFEWTIGNTTFTENSANCQAYTDDLSYEIVAIDAVNPALCSDELIPKTDDCTYFNFTFSGNEICVDTDYNGPIEWDINGNTNKVDENDCFNYNPNMSYEADAVNTNNPLCSAQLQPDQPELVKRARRGGGTTYSMDVLTLRADDATIDYQLTYTPVSNQKYSTFITDTISKGYIEAILLPDGSGVNPGRIEYIPGSMKIIVGGSTIQSCTSLPDEAEIEDCYAGDIGNGNVRLVKVRGEALITYRGKVNSALTDEVCKGGTICQEKYLNNAETSNSIVHVDEENSDDIPEVTSNEIKAQIFCQYILTRAAGDIFLENDLSTGVDISICSKFRSSTGIIITPGDKTTPPLVSTGAGDTTIKAIGHEVCTAGQAGDSQLVDSELAQLYGAGVSGLSSQICEVKLRTGSPWKQEVITNSIDENKTRASRWGAESLGNVLSTILSAYPNQNVYHLKGKVSSGNIRMDEIGAKTFIIEDGDLYIDQDIEYTGNCTAEQGQCSVRDVGSLAFIVLNGNIYVDPRVKTISGVFFVQEGETAGTGQLISGNPDNPNQRADENRLTIYGSVYGDIDPLFQQRFFAGDPALDEGGIVVRFDQRVILNTPPGLRDILNINQTEVAR